MDVLFDVVMRPLPESHRIKKGVGYSAIVSWASQAKLILTDSNVARPTQCIPEIPDHFKLRTKKAKGKVRSMEISNGDAPMPQPEPDIHADGPENT
jgi:hypothetical protein